MTKEISLDEPLTNMEKVEFINAINYQITRQKSLSGSVATSTICM